MQLNEPIHDIESGKFLFFLHGKMGGIGGCVPTLKGAKALSYLTISGFEDHRSGMKSFGRS